MKTTVKELDYDIVKNIPLPEHRLPKKPSLFFRTLLRVLSGPAVKEAGFTMESEGMEQIPKEQPCLILMNHSCFLDLQIVSKVFYPKPYCIVCTSDGFVGMGGLMEKLMRAIGCIPTRKFVTDVTLVQDITHCLKEEKTSVLMYPEASYSFDGTATPLPQRLGILLKRFDVPVVMIETFGAFSRNPLYNELQIRKSVPVHAKVKCLFTQEQVRSLKCEELTAGVEGAFTFDHFRWQRENGVEIHDDFRADGLHRILYKCPHCGCEGKTVGKGTTLTCTGCGKVYTLTPLGELEAVDGDAAFTHIPDWYAWERRQVREELEQGSYSLETAVDIAMLMDFKAIYKVGSGHLSHSAEGFRLTGCDGRLEYVQKPTACYGLYADYYWYEIGDMICIGDNEQLYYCFPKDDTPVAKTRLAVEELYRMKKRRARSIDSSPA